MADRTSKGTQAERLEPDLALSELGRALTASAVAEAGAAAALDPGEAPTEVELTMADLITDDNGEIVFFNDSGFRSLGLTTEAAVVANGQAETHVTAGGADVSGFHYVTFDNGLTLYYEGDLDLVVHAPPVT